MSWKPAPVIGGAYSDDAKSWTCQDTVNYIPVMAERPGGRSPVMLRGAPGMVTFCDTGSGKPIRGARNVEGLLLVVTGTTLYRVSTTGAAMAIGTIPGVGRVSMSHNQITGGNEVAIANGQSGYVYNTVTGTLAQITDEGFPGSISFDFIDGYITGIEPARRFAFHSNLAAATDYNTLDRHEAEGSPDKLVGQIVDHREWWLFSERTIEPFVNTGAATNTFQRASNTMIEVGCASGAAIAQMDSSVFWVGNDGIVYRANGYTPQRISTHAIEQALAKCNLSQCFAFTFEDQGHKVYYITCPDGQTWGYDASSGEWHRRQSEGLSRWRINTLTKWNGAWIAGDYSSGKLYMLDWNVQHEDGAVLERRRITGALHDNQNRVTVDGVALVFDTGVTPSDTRYADMRLAGVYAPATIGSAYSSDLTISGGNGSYSNARVIAGALPSGLVLGIVGTPGDYRLRLSGTPTGTAMTASFTVAVDSGDQQSATSDQAVVVIYHTAALLHFDGTNGSTIFTDQTGKAWTPLGTPTISTAQSKFGGASGLFPGNGAISTPYHSDLDLLSVSAFTIECFVYHTASGDHRIFTLGGSDFAANATTGYHLLLQVDNGNRLALTLSNGTAAPINVNSSGVLVPLNAWTYVAASVDAGAARLYLNANRVAQVSSPAIVRPSGNPFPCIGRITAQGTGNDWRGNIDELLITNGAAKYNGLTITVPTAPFSYP